MKFINRKNSTEKHDYGRHLPVRQVRERFRAELNSGGVSNLGRPLI